jgi:hypothetical protein
MYTFEQCGVEARGGYSYDRDLSLWLGLQKLPLGLELPVTVESSVFQHIMPYSQLKIKWCLRRICHLHLWGKRISQARNRHEWSLLPASCLLLIWPILLLWNGFDLMLQNTGWFSMDHISLNPRRQNSSPLWEPRILQCCKLQFLAVFINICPIFFHSISSF